MWLATNIDTCIVLVSGWGFEFDECHRRCWEAGGGRANRTVTNLKGTSREPCGNLTQSQMQPWELRANLRPRIGCPRVWLEQTMRVLHYTFRGG